MTVLDDLPAPMEGVYPFTSDEPDGAIVLHTGPVTVVRGDEESTGDGRVWVSVRDGLSVLWQVALDSGVLLEDVVFV